MHHQKSWEKPGENGENQGVGLLHPRHSNAVRNIVPPWQPKKASTTSVRENGLTTGWGGEQWFRNVADDIFQKKVVFFFVFFLVCQKKKY